MTDNDRAELQRLMPDKAFLAFLYRMIVKAGLFSTAPINADPRFYEGRRSLCLDLLAEIEAAQEAPSPDGLPVLSSIQIFLSIAQSAPKEKNLGRRSDPYRDLSDGADASE